MKSFIDRISTQDWSGVFDCPREDVNVMWEIFSDKFSQLFDVCFPRRFVRLREHRKIPSSPYIKSLKMLLDSLFVISQHKPEHISHYRSLKKRHDNAIKSARQMQFRDTVDNSNNKSRTVWKLVNESLGKGKPTSNLENESDPYKIVNEFNDFFINIASQLGSGAPSNNFNSDIIKQQEKSFY